MRWQTAFQQGFNHEGMIAEDKQTKKAAFDVIAQAVGEFLERLAAENDMNWPWRLWVDTSVCGVRRTLQFAKRTSAMY